MSDVNELSIFIYYLSNLTGSKHIFNVMVMHYTGEKGCCIHPRIEVFNLSSTVTYQVL